MHLVKIIQDFSDVDFSIDEIVAMRIYFEGDLEEDILPAASGISLINENLNGSEFNYDIKNHLDVTISTYFSTVVAKNSRGEYINWGYDSLIVQGKSSGSGSYIVSPPNKQIENSAFLNFSWNYYTALAGQNLTRNLSVNEI